MTDISYRIIVSQTVMSRKARRAKGNADAGHIRLSAADEMGWKTRNRLTFFAFGGILSTYIGLYGRADKLIT